MFSFHKFFLLLLLSQVLLHRASPRSHHHSSHSSGLGSIFDNSDDNTTETETNPVPPTTPAVPSVDDVPEMSPEEAAQLVENPIPPLSESESDPMVTELNEIMEGQHGPERDTETFLTHFLEGSFTEYEQESAWFTEYEAYELVNGEIVDHGYVPIDPEVANVDSAVQDALKFGIPFVIERGIASGELATDDAVFQQLLTASSRSFSDGTEYEFYVEISDPGAPEGSQFLQALFTVFVDSVSGQKGVTSYNISNKDF